METRELGIRSRNYRYFSLSNFAEENGITLSRLPVSLKIMLENLLRHSESKSVSREDMLSLAYWDAADKGSRRAISFFPGRVIMQDLTGGPAIADLAAMRDALHQAGGESAVINPMIPVDMVIDHSVMVDFYGNPDSFKKNVEKEFQRNQERYRFFKWGQQAFSNFRVVPPGTGIVHQVNLEYLASVVSRADKTGDEPEIVFPDTLVGTDSHTTMINAMGVLGWGVGGIEAEAAMLGQPLSMIIPDVVGFRFKGNLKPGTTATDLVLQVVQMLREYGVVGCFVEFFGSGLSSLSLADRATISNMAPEYGATCGFFPIDDELIDYLRLTGREEEQIELVEKYAKLQGLWRDDGCEAHYSAVLELDLAGVEPAMAGPRRPQDLVPLEMIPETFAEALNAVYQVPDIDADIPVKSMTHRMSHGDVVIAAITSCTNTSNPEILITAGLIAKKAVELGLISKPWVKTSFAPGSQVVTSYLENASLMTCLEKLGFYLSAYGCTTCIGNSGPLPENVAAAVTEGDLVAVNILSGNRNFEGRINPLSKASYLASPPLVVLYALAGSVRINLLSDPLCRRPEGKEVFLKDLWPDESEIKAAVSKALKPELFRRQYRDVFKGPKQWHELEVTESELYDWQPGSTYIRRPPFFDSFMEKSGRSELTDITGARCLAIFSDSTTTDHISPAGNIPADSPAGSYLMSKGIDAGDFNSYGSRRANHDVMVRGTFANIRIKNSMLAGIEGGYTRDRSGKITSIFEAAMSWNGSPLLVFGGEEYGTGSSRDWAAKGPHLQGVEAVIVKSFERIHRSNLLGMGILPLEFTGDDSVLSLGIQGDEVFSINGIVNIKPLGELELRIMRPDAELITAGLRVRIDTELELQYWKSGGILNYVLSRFMKNIG